MPRPLAPVLRRLLLSASLVIGFAGDTTDAVAQVKKPAARKLTTVANPAVPVKPRTPPPPLEITCGPPLIAIKVEKKGLLGKLKGDKAPKLPEACVLSRFKDPAFPVSDPTSRGQSAVGLFGGAGPVPANWERSQAELQRVADEIADLGPRPSVRARVLLSGQNMAEARAVFQGDGGKDGLIVLSTQLIQSLRDLSQNTPNQTDELTQQYLAFVIAHEYAHLVLNHPQQLRFC